MMVNRTSTHRSMAQGILINTFSLAIADIANKLMSLIFFLVAARHLGPEKFGIFSFAIAFVTIFTVFPDMGLGMLTTREIARNRLIARRLIGNGTTLRLTGALIVWCLILLLVTLLHYPVEVVTTVYITSLFVLINALFSYYASIFLGFERNEFVAIIRLVQTALLAGGALLLTRGIPSPFRYAWLYVGANAIAALAAFVILSTKFVQPAIYWDLSEWRRMLKLSWPFAVALVLVTSYYWNGSIFLSKFWGPEEVGIYNASFRLMYGAGFPAAAFSAAMYPVIARVFVDELERVQKMLARGARYMINLGVPVALFGTILSRPLIQLFYGSKYIKSVSSLQVLAWWGGCVYLNSLLSIYFYAINRPKIPTLQPGVSLAVNVFLNLLLIPRWGAVGAGWSIFAAEAIGLGILVWSQFLTPCGVPAGVFIQALLRAGLAALVTAPLAWFAARWHPAAGVTAAFLVYGGLLLITRGIEIDDVKLVFQELFLKRAG